MSDIESLRLVLSTNTSWAEYSTIAVFIGLLGDIIVIIAFELFDPHKTWLEIGLAGAASLVIATGVLGEWRYGHRASRASSELEARLENLTSAANERAANAQLAAEHEKMARLEFEKLYGPRRFTKEQRDELATYWHKYAGRIVEIGAVSDPETWAFMRVLSDILKKAGLTVKQISPFMPSGNLGVFAWGPVRIADDLANSLNCAGVYALMFPTCGLPSCLPTKQQPADCPLRIEISLRPMSDEMDFLPEKQCKRPWAAPIFRCGK